MNKKWLLVILVFYLSLLFTLTIPFKEYNVTLPGNITNVSSSLKFEDDLHNQFYTTYVISYDKPTLFQLLAAKIATKADTSDNTLKDYYYDGFLDEELSFQYSTIIAYETAALEKPEININYSLVGYSVVISKDKTILGDIFTKIDNLDLLTISYQELIDYLETKTAITVEALRNNQQVSYSLTKENDKFNLSLKPFYKIISLTPNYEKNYHKDNIGGPSGGLIQALFIYYQIMQIKLDLKIAGTGTITKDGLVGKIGGITQKIFTVDKKVEIFICPIAHYDEAMLAYNSIKKPAFELVFVNSFLEAVSYLNNYE